MSFDKNIQAQRINGLAAEIAAVGGVTGSGTLNYIAKWTPSGIVVGNSIIYDNGTNVGIGTASPSTQFQISTPNTSQASYNFSVVNGSDVIFAGLNNGYFGINCTPSKRVEIFENNNTDEFIKYTNTSSGSSARTGLNIVNDLNSNLLLINTSSNYTPYGAMESNKSVLYSGNDLVLMSDLGSRMIFATGSAPATEKMTLLSNGNFGVGETIPTATIHAKGIDSTSSNYALKVDNSASSPLLYVRNDGNVGINTSNPTSKLQVVGLATYVDNSAAITAGLTTGAFYIRTGHGLDIVVTGGGGSVTLKVTNITSSATPSIDYDVDQYNITALATDITSVSLSGTFVDRQRLIVTIKDNGTARTITWGSSFNGTWATLPTTTVVGNTWIGGFIYNATTSKYECVASFFSL